MPHDWSELIKRISGHMRTLRGGAPETMKAFSAMAVSASASGALDAKTKELIALAIGVAARCDGCIGFHTQALIKLGTTKEELAEMLGVAVMMGGGPSLMFAGETMRAYEEFGGQ